jgi:hypothetical protein
MTSVAQFANQSLSEVTPGMLSVSDADRSPVGGPELPVLICPAAAFVAFTVATLELADQIRDAVNTDY